MSMKFEEFQATGVDCENLGQQTQDHLLEGIKGRIYCGTLWIEDATTWTGDAPGYGKGKWYTRIGRCEYLSDNLEEVEKELYKFAVSEGYTTEESKTVADLFAENGFHNAMMPPENSFLREIPASSHVGEESKKAIAAGVEFARKLDKHSDVKDLVAQAIVEHVRIIYFG